MISDPYVVQEAIELLKKNQHEKIQFLEAKIQQAKDAIRVIEELEKSDYLD